MYAIRNYRFYTNERTNARTERVIYIRFVYIVFNWKEDKQHTRIKKKVFNKLRFNFNSIQQQKKKYNFFNGKIYRKSSQLIQIKFYLQIMSIIQQFSKLYLSKKFLCTSLWNTHSLTRAHTFKFSLYFSKLNFSNYFSNHLNDTGKTKTKIKSKLKQKMSPRNYFML